MYTIHLWQQPPTKIYPPTLYPIETLVNAASVISFLFFLIGIHGVEVVVMVVGGGGDGELMCGAVYGARIFRTHHITYTTYNIYSHV